MNDDKQTLSAGTVTIHTPLDFKVGDRVTRAGKHGTVIRVSSAPNIYERLHAVRWDDGAYEDAFFWWGLRYE